jgi:hypothetical protein
MTEPVMPVAHCYRCGTETQMYHNNVPVCPTCLARLKAQTKSEFNETI